MTAQESRLAEEAHDAGESPPADAAGTERTGAVARIAVALVITWTALVAIPGAMPWAAADDTARGLGIGIGVATIIAIVGLALAWVREDQIGTDGATVGVAAALAALALAALAVVNLMLVPDNADYRQTVIGIGLLVLIAIGLVVVAAMRVHLFEGLRFTSLTVVGALVGVAIVAVYFLMINSMFAAAGPDTKDAEWTRLNTLLTGVQTLAFAALGALLGTTIQNQVTTGVREELHSTQEVTEDLAAAAAKAKEQIATLTETSGGAMDVALLDALNEDPGQFRSVTARRRWIEAHRPVDAEAMGRVSDELDRALERSKRVLRS